MSCANLVCAISQIYSMHRFGNVFCPVRVAGSTMGRRRPTVFTSLQSHKFHVLVRNVLILDEPTNDLDAAAFRKFRVLSFGTKESMPRKVTRTMTLSPNGMKQTDDDIQKLARSTDAASTLLGCC